MTYVLSSDTLFRTVGLRLAGKDAALLYALALHECAAVDGNGVLTPLMVKDAAGLFDLSWKRLAPRLVEQGMWHDPLTLDECDDCSDRTETLNPGEYLIHRWWEPLLHQAGKDDPIKRDRELRRKRLNRNKALVTSIRKRDRDLCRYCGVETLDSSGPDKKSALVRTLDHVDPWGENTLANVVVACRRCNGVKRDRRPEDAGMVLLRPGTRAGSDPAHPAHDPDSAGSSRERPRETGPIRIASGRDGSGSGPWSDPVLDLHQTNGHSTNGAHA